MSRNEILSALRDFKSQSARQYGILEMGIFGSVARDEATGESDVDVFVKTATPNPFILVHLKHAIEDRLGQKVDIVRWREKMNPMLKRRIERDGVYV
ncbi:MAG: nucleotidyltransferase domain-containing protein [Sedimentisphaerales bacterium]|nr:nucleotidyltransferase domain-containing protein [Sedimentisphaerales bacterium]